MTDRQTALAYGLTGACLVALVLLMFDSPSDRNLAIAIVTGLLVGGGSFLYLRNR